MDLRRIRYFLAVADAGSFTRAAEMLGIGQPPLSLQIKTLEEEIGAVLFRRLRHGVSLTEAGIAFRAHVSGLQRQVDAAAKAAQRAARGELGILRLGFTGLAALTPQVARSVKLFRAQYPDVDVSIEETNSAHLAQSIKDDRLDVAFLRPGTAMDADIAYARTYLEPLVIALPAEHGLTNREHPALTVSDLAGEGFILTPRNAGPSLHDAVVACCQKAGFTPNIVGMAPQGLSVLALVAAGLGVSLLPRSILTLNFPDVAFRELTDSSASVSLALAHRHASTAIVVRNFVATARLI